MGALMNEHHCRGCNRTESNLSDLRDHELYCEEAIRAEDRAEITRLRAALNTERTLRERRDRQVVWVARRRAFVERGGVISPGQLLVDFGVGRDPGYVLTYRYDGSDAGLLAAVDKASGI